VIEPPAGESPGTVGSPDIGESPGHAAPRPSPADDARLLDEIDAELTGVDAALRRLDDGSYAHCEVCGTPIPPDALGADPLITRCAAHPR
jgi:RNA polymerase-binding transcription factor DksA